LRSVNIFATGRARKLVNGQSSDVKNFSRIITEDGQGVATFPEVEVLHEQAVNVPDHLFSGISLTIPPTRISPICHVLKPRCIRANVFITKTKSLA